jgi:hypothetical protein
MAALVTHQVENAETGEMETFPGKPCECGICKGEKEPLFPGDPDRHDAAAGDKVVYIVEGLKHA